VRHLADASLLRHAPAAISIAVLAACSADEERPPSAVDATAIEVQAISAIRDREIGFFSTGMADSLAGLLTVDVQIMPPNEPAIVGIAAAQRWAHAQANRYIITGRYTGASITFAGDIAVEQYTAKLTVTPKTGGGAPTTETIKGMHVYRRQADGSWKIAQDVWNTDAPSPSATPRR
jgi:ketosteroid isomerase-like protein